ncbi:MAG: hypothetical protein WD605_01895 [Candidatus Paceibacterota bacterium]
MSGFESIRKVAGGAAEDPKMVAEQESFAEEEREGSVEELKDKLFDRYLKQQLIEDFFGDLGDYLDSDDVDEMRGELAGYEDEDIYATLSLPYELRDRKFEEFQKEIESNDKKPSDLMKKFIEVNKRYGFGLGYHTSPHDIRPDDKGHWTVKGFEKDHRDNDLSKAYYSTKYRHLFKNRDPKFIYIVRTDPDTHGTDGNWSRAGMLSVVTRVPFPDVVEYVEENARDIEKKKAGD